MDFIVGADDLAATIERVQAVPQARAAARFRPGARRAGEQQSALRDDARDEPAQFRFLREQIGHGGLGPDHVADSLRAGRGRKAHLPVHVIAAQRRFPFERLFDARLHEAQHDAVDHVRAQRRGARQTQAPAAPNERGQEQHGGDEDPAPTHVPGARLDQDRRRRSRQNGDQRQAPDAAQRGQLQHRRREAPDGADQVPGKAGEDPGA